MIERRLRFGIEDIKGICLECLSCKGRVHLPLDRIKVLPQKCPVCSIDWEVIVLNRSASNSDYANFAFSLSRLLDAVRQGNGMPFKVLLEFAEPEAHQ